MKDRILTIVLNTISYILVAAVASAVTLVFFCPREEYSKLDELQALIQEKFIAEADATVLQDAAAAAMVDALPDRWSYYVSAEEYTAYEENKNNSYVGIGITIQLREDGSGMDILLVEPGSPAQEAGIRPGDVLTQVQGQSVVQLGLDGTRNLVRGEEGTRLTVEVLRDGQTLTLEVERRQIQVQVASGQLLEGNVGLVTITNFNTNCVSATTAAVEALISQGAEALIFDVRYNPGGYKSELVELLDYLLPEGPLFRSVDYKGVEKVDESDEKCLEMPMAVLVNGSSYSAAEFFAAALAEYDWATVVGAPTSGKGYYQSTYNLKDGSAVALSVGKYTTPNGVSLEEVGGLVPDVVVEIDDEMFANIYAGLVEPMEDPQILAAITVLK